MNADSSTTTLIEHLDFILTVDEHDRELRDGAILVQRDRIQAVGTTEEVLQGHSPDSIDEVINGRGLGATPGFVDTHVHLSETLSRAVFPDNLGTRAWVFHWAKPFYAHVNTEDERISVLTGTAEMLRSGTTCFLDMGAQNDP
ncbi:MAG: amidohydrolase family protein, partial [Actinobacteria bacterium]|nr:amidohydrolase family protein [Actinomycetota bacterium]